MKKATKKLLITAASLTVFGLIIFAAAMSALNWDFMKLSTTDCETNTYEITEEFDNISLDTYNADIAFALSDNGKCVIECREEGKAKHSVAVQNSTLIVSAENNKSWYDYIGINFLSPQITVYLPRAEFATLLIKDVTGNIEIPDGFVFSDAEIDVSTGNIDFFADTLQGIKMKTTTGNINAQNLSAGSVELSVSTGDATVSNVACNGDVTVNVSTGDARLTDISCKNATSGGSTGDIFLKNVTAAEKFSIVRSTGDVTLDASDAAEIFIKTTTGDVIGGLLTDKVFITDTHTGDVLVPHTANGGRCEINTNTGDIKINIG